jgi:hypothetical protein
MQCIEFYPLLPYICISSVHLQIGLLLTSMRANTEALPPFGDERHTPPV